MDVTLINGCRNSDHFFLDFNKSRTTCVLSLLLQNAVIIIHRLDSFTGRNVAAINSEPGCGTRSTHRPNYITILTYFKLKLQQLGEFAIFERSLNGI